MMKTALRAVQNANAALLKLLLNLPSDELERVAKKQFQLRLEIYSSKQNAPIRQTSKEGAHAQVLQALEGASNREEGSTILGRNFPDKASLVEFAKYIQAHVNTKMSMDKIVTTIVESTTGARIRSKAIQG